MYLRVILGFAIALAGALVALRLRIPLPWMLGPLLLTAVTRVSGLQTECPRPLRNAGLWTIGVSLGLYFTPQVLGHIVANGAAILAGMLFAIVLAAFGTWFLQRLAAVDFHTAWFAAAIGGASEMSNLAERYGARVDRVASAHSLRLLMVVLIVPFAFQAWGVAGTDPTIPGPRVVHWAGLGLLVALSSAAAAAFQRLRAPNPWVLGPLAVAMALTSQSIELSALPEPVLKGGQLLIGWSLGDRFRPGFLRAAPRFLGSVALLTLLLLVLSAGFGWLLSSLTAAPLPTLMLGTTPGGISEMTITARVLQLGVPLVTTFHVTRMVFVVVVTGPLYVWLARRRAADSAGKETLR